MILCYGESSLFPESDFLHTEDGKLYQPSIHHVQPEHWATTGEIVDVATLPGYVSYDRATGVITIDSAKIKPPINNGPKELPIVR